MYKTLNLIEGVYADQYSSADVKAEILNAYTIRYSLKESPLTHPEKFNPLTPPEGWKYDPFYECWIEVFSKG
jgi:hypothetical protein